MLSPMNERPFVIRPATPSDLPLVGRMGAALLRDHYAFDRQRFLAPRGNSEAGYAAFLGSQLHRDDTFVAVADRNGEVVGYVYAGIEPLSWKELRDEAGFVHDVYVLESARGQGVATALTEAAARWLADHGMPRVLLWTAAPNAAARRLFSRLGFRETMIEMTRET
jgi:ribosomal protein S18 acetylase RimI-like enzyme